MFNCKGEKNMNNTEILRKIQSIYGDKAVCTNGLFHIIRDDRSESYINCINGKIDNRAVYRTVIVLKDTVIANILNSGEYVILDKKTLRYMYRTQNIIHYVDDNILYENDNNYVNVILSNGKKVMSLKDAVSVENIYSNNYLVKSDKIFNDRLLVYNSHRESIKDLTENKNYMINKDIEEEKNLLVTVMSGGQYIYNLKDHKCFNKFTNKEENGANIWKFA